MERIRIGVLCPSEIAFRRFIPAIQKQSHFEFMGIAYANELEWFGKESADNDQSILLKEKGKAQNFVNTYGGHLFESYNQMLTSDYIDAVYLPLPPALHFQWGKIALENGKHLFMEKPFTTSLRDTQELVSIAQHKELALHENYMFQYHNQLNSIKQIIDSGKIGELRLIQINFGFPFRGMSDFRYNKALGGGALLDCGGYTIKLASLLLGDTARLSDAILNYKDGLEVDIGGSATMRNPSGLTVQIAFGMDNNYRCSLDVWGSSGSLFTDRVFTAPGEFSPTMAVKLGNEVTEQKLEPDDSFGKSIVVFLEAIKSSEVRKKNITAIVRQSEHIEKFQEIAR
jgi:predicted dehydrogenase